MMATPTTDFVEWLAEPLVIEKVASALTCREFESVVAFLRDEDRQDLISQWHHHHRASDEEGDAHYGQDEFPIVSPPRSDDDRLSRVLANEWLASDLLQIEGIDFSPVGRWLAGSNRPSQLWPMTAVTPDAVCCSECGSANVYRDAYVGVNDQTDIKVFDGLFCDDCEGPCTPATEPPTTTTN